MKLLSTFLLFLGLQSSFAQKETRFWYFNNKVGFDFGKNPPEFLKDSKMVTVEGCATMSDKNSGDLLFYTNGMNIWNRNHELMPHGKNYPPDCGSPITQSALIVPKPGNPTQYYLFSIHATKNGKIDTLANCAASGFNINEVEISYSVVDMSLENGLGDIVDSGKNIFLESNSTEKLTAIPHENNADYWLVTHEFNSDIFNVYLINENGVSKSRKNKIGSVYGSIDFPGLEDADEKKGYLKASPNGKKLASATHSDYKERPFDLFDFDPSTGVISNYINLGNLINQYGVSFSTDNSKLYITTSSGNSSFKDVIRQYDLSKTTVQEIIDSGNSILRNNPFSNINSSNYFVSDAYCALELGMDAKIYLSSIGYPNDKFIVINKPNEVGFNCEVNYITVPKYDQLSTSFTGLPNFMQSYFNNLKPIENCNYSDVILYPNPTDRFLNIKQECVSIKNIEIYNELGQLIKNLPGYNNLIDLMGIQSGFYILLIRLYDGKLITKKIIKQ